MGQAEPSWAQQGRKQLGIRNFHPIILEIQNETELKNN